MNDIYIHIPEEPIKGGLGGVPYPLTPATATKLGGVKVGDGLFVAEDGTLALSDTSPSVLIYEVNSFQYINDVIPDDGYRYYMAHQVRADDGKCFVPIVIIDPTCVSKEILSSEHISNVAVYHEGIVAVRCSAAVTQATDLKATILLVESEEYQEGCTTVAPNVHMHNNTFVLDGFRIQDNELYWGNTPLGLNEEHTNKSLLDSYSQTESDLADAVRQKHVHSNQEVLNKINESDGMLTFDGAAIIGDSVSAPTERIYYGTDAPAEGDYYIWINPDGVNDLPVPAFAIVNKNYAASVVIQPNVHTHISTLEGSIVVSLGNPIGGYDNEWAFTITQGATAYSVTLPEVVWIGREPDFSANTTLECRLFYVGNTLKGVAV